MGGTAGPVGICAGVVGAPAAAGWKVGAGAESRAGAGTETGAGSGAGAGTEAVGTAARARTLAQARSAAGARTTAGVWAAAGAGTEGFVGAAGGLGAVPAVGAVAVSVATWTSGRTVDGVLSATRDGLVLRASDPAGVDGGVAGLDVDGAGTWLAGGTDGTVVAAGGLAAGGEAGDLVVARGAFGAGEEEVEGPVVGGEAATELEGEEDRMAAVGPTTAWRPPTVPATASVAAATDAPASRRRRPVRTERRRISPRRT